MSVLAYAVSVNGQVNTSTVHGHARGAMVNFIYLQGVPVGDNWPDEKIRAVFTRGGQMALEAGVRVELVLLELQPVSTVSAETVDLTAEPKPVAAGPD